MPKSLESTTDVRTHLTNTVRDEKARFLALAEAFYRQSERSAAQCLQLMQELIATVERVEAAGDWQQSQFLRHLIAPLRELAQQAQAVAAHCQPAKRGEVSALPELQPTECKIFISLYQAEGHDLKKWEAQLRSIDAYLVGRPIYKEEADIRSMIRQKLVGVSEAYAVAVVPRAAILANDYTAKKTDRNGFELLTVEPTALSPANVMEFVHLNKRYRFSKQRLQSMDVA